MKIELPGYFYYSTGKIYNNKPLRNIYHIVKYDEEHDIFEAITNFDEERWNFTLNQFNTSCDVYPYLILLSNIKNKNLAKLTGFIYD